MPLFLAIDSGGTQTQYVLADESTVLARATGGTIKRMRVSAEQAAANLSKALASLEAGSGHSTREVSLTCIGAAGSSTALVADWLRDEFSARVGGRLLLLNDVEIALDAAFHGGPGVLVLAGTGSNVVGRTADGTLAGAGGWGPVLGDEASGHRIGTEALRALFLAIDREEPSSLLPLFLEHWHLKTRADLVEFANSCALTEFSPLSLLVGRAASAGDAVATRVLEAEGRQLGDQVRLVLRRLAAHDRTAEHSPIAFSGGVMEHLSMVRSALLAHVREEFPQAQERSGVSHGVDGALWRARQAFAAG